MKMLNGYQDMLPMSNLLILVKIRMVLMDWGMTLNILTGLEIKISLRLREKQMTRIVLK